MNLENRTKILLKRLSLIAAGTALLASIVAYHDLGQEYYGYKARDAGYEIHRVYHKEHFPFGSHNSLTIKPIDNPNKIEPYVLHFDYSENGNIIGFLFWDKDGRTVCASTHEPYCDIDFTNKANDLLKLAGQIVPLDMSELRKRSNDSNMDKMIF